MSIPQVPAVLAKLADRRPRKNGTQGRTVPVTLTRRFRQFTLFTVIQVSL